MGDDKLGLRLRLSVTLARAGKADPATFADALDEAMREWEEARLPWLRGSEQEMRAYCFHRFYRAE